MVFRPAHGSPDDTPAVQAVDLFPDAPPEVFPIVGYLRSSRLLVLLRAGLDRLRRAFYSGHAVRAFARHCEESRRHIDRRHLLHLSTASDLVLRDSADRPIGDSDQP